MSRVFLFLLVYNDLVDLLRTGVVVVVVVVGVVVVIGLLLLRCSQPVANVIVDVVAHI